MSNSVGFLEKIAYFLAPKVVRQTQSKKIVDAWYVHEQSFCRGYLAHSFLGAGLLMLGFIPLDMNLGSHNPSWYYALVLRGVPSLFMLGIAIYLRSSKPKPFNFIFAKILGIVIVTIFVSLQYQYVTDFPDRARFYPPLIAAIAVYTLRVDWRESLLIAGVEISVWLLYLSDNSTLLLKDINYQLFGIVLGILFQRRIAYEAASFVSDEKHKSIERENERLQKNRATSLLQRFLSEKVAQDLLSRGLDLHAKPERKTVTILYCDLVDFTKLSETMPLPKLGELLNQYFSAMTGHVFAQGGMLDKFISDGVLAIFGFPNDLSLGEQAERAAQCARDMLKTVALIQGDLMHRYHPSDLQLRIGIFQGDAIVGGFGNALRTDYMALGVAPLMAQRLKATAPANGIHISESVAEALGYAGCEDRGERQLRGIGPRRVFQLLAEPSYPYSASAGRISELMSA